MSLITISRGTFSGGKDFATHLAEHLGYRCLSREDLTEEAVKADVPVGKLQTSIIKPPRVSQRMGPQRAFYLSCITSILCKYALEGNLVYHGHTGHLLLPGVPHIFRVRVLGNMEYRIANVIERLHLSREKAIEYIRKVDADRDKWVRFLYGVDWHDPSHYDLVVNLDQMGVDNCTTALCSMAELPDFQLTPASRRALQDLYLSSRARFLLARDKRTNYAEFKVTANKGVVQVTCMPQQAEAAPFVSEILQGLEGCQEVHTTIAGSNVLWLGERFNPDSELYRNVVKVAKRWDAAVEVMRCCAAERLSSDGKEDQPITATALMSHEETGGIEDDVEEAVEKKGADPVLDALLKDGCSGGASAIYGDAESLLTTLGHRTNYSLVVIGELFLNKSEKARTRLTAEMRSILSDNLKAPVVSSDELKQTLKFGGKDYVKLGLYLVVALIMFAAVFANQEPVLRFMADDAYKSWRIFAILGVVIFVPLFAYVYGTSTRQIFRLLGLD